MGTIILSSYLAVGAIEGVFHAVGMNKMAQNNSEIAERWKSISTRVGGEGTAKALVFMTFTALWLPMNVGALIGKRKGN